MFNNCRGLADYLSFCRLGRGEDTLNNQAEVIASLRKIGIEPHHAQALRAISMTLHRWHELECGIGDGAIERDEKTGKPYWYNTNARYVDPRDPRARSGIRDRETGALKRLKRIMSKYPMLGYYVQGDPRGCALYILRPGDVPEGCEADSYYNRGVAVYK